MVSSRSILLPLLIAVLSAGHPAGASQAKPAREFSSSPVRPVPILRASRDEGRSAWFRPSLRRDLDQARLKWAIEDGMGRGEIQANAWPALASLVLESGSGGGTAGGGEAPGEGGTHGGGSQNQGGGGMAGGVGGGLMGEANSNTGNNLLTLAIVSFPSRGESNVSITLAYNSRENWNETVGKKWSHSYDARISHTPGSSAIVRMPDGLLAPFSQQGNTFVRPPGWNHRLERHANGTWTKTFHNQSQWIFDSGGRLAETKDPYGNTTQIHRDSQGRVSSVVSADGRAVAWDYNSDGRLATITDPANRQWSFSYDSLGRLTGVAFPLLNGQIPSRHFAYNSQDFLISEQDLRTGLWQWEYDTQGRVTSNTNPMGHRTTIAYGSGTTTFTLPGGQSYSHTYANGLLVQATDPAGFVRSATYGPNRDILTETDESGHTWTATYDGNGNLLTLTNPLGQTDTLLWNAANQWIRHTNALGHQVERTFDTGGRLTEIKDGLGRQVARWTYDGFGQALTHQDALGRLSAMTYSPRGEVETIVDPAGVTQSFGYDILSRPAWQKDADQNQTTFTYDGLGRVRQVTYPGGAIEKLSFDPEGLLLSHEDPLGHIQLFGYDMAKNRTQSVDALGHVEFVATNSNGWVTSITDRRGHTRTLEYTARGEVRRMVLADGAVTQWTLSPTGEVASITSPLGGVTSTQFDPLGRPLAVTYPVGTPGVSYSYDPAGRLVSMADGSGITTWEYNAANEVTALNQPGGRLEYLYNLAGQRTHLIEVGHGTTLFGYDTAGRLASVSNRFNETTTLGYDSRGLPWQTVFANGLVESRSFDARGRPSGIVLVGGQGGILTQSFSYDSASRLISRTENGVQTIFTHDPVGRVIGESRPGFQAAYAYDAQGNRISRTVNGATELAFFDSGDKILAIAGPQGTTSFGYDAAGRTTQIARPGGTTSISYDGAYRVTSISGPGFSETASHNGLGARVGGLRDGASANSPLLRDAAASYTGSWSERRAGATNTFHHGLKDAVALSSGTGTLLGTRHYDAFGQVQSQSQAWPSPLGHGASFGYNPGASGLTQIGHRVYDSTTGRFLTRDPAQDGRNWYSYGAGESSPLTHADPEGLFRQVVIYALRNKAGEIMKYGITKNPNRRYSKAYLKGNGLQLQEVCRYESKDYKGNRYERYKQARRAALEDERILVNEMGGPMNREPWSASRLAKQAVMAHQTEVLASRPEITWMDWIPGLAELKMIFDEGIKWLDSWVMEAQENVIENRFQYYEE